MLSDNPNPPASREEALFMILAAVLMGMGGSVSIPALRFKELDGNMQIRREEFEDRLELHLEWPE